MKIGWIIAIILFSLFVIVGLITDYDFETEEPRNIEATQNIKETPKEEKVNVPDVCKKGAFQLEWSHCVDLCIYTKDDDIDYNWDLCYDKCDKVEYYEGSKGLQEYNRKMRCKICGIDCLEKNSSVTK